jgi:hypothetical protein
MTVLRRALALSLILLLAGGGASAPRARGAAVALSPIRPSAVYPLRLSPNHRYLVDSKKRPFLMVGDSPQALIVKLTLPQVARYLADRRARGFNAIWVNLLCNDRTGGFPDGATRDGIGPFSTPEDLATPNEAYFRRVDAVLRLAARNGIVVLLDPVETAGWLDVLLRSGVEKDFAYGRYLGLRYRSQPNIIWFNGNDLQRWRDPEVTDVVTAVARGIKSVDPVHIQTVELDYPTSGSRDDPRWTPIIGLDAAYTYFPTYAQVLKEYNRRDYIPTFMVEASYEFESYYQSPHTLRRQEYWSLLSGATGQLYGNHYTWQFLEGWEDRLDTPGTSQFAYVTKLFAPRRWYELVPDQKHRLVTAGYGTFAPMGKVNANDYVTAARTPDGKLAIAYLPAGRPVKVNLTMMSGRVRAQWYDPTNGRYSPAATALLPHSHAKRFVPPGKNHERDHDWVIVLAVA